MLCDDLAIYHKTKESVRAILVRRRQLAQWTKMLDDEENCGYSVVTYWRNQYAALHGVLMESN